MKRNLFIVLLCVFSVCVLSSYAEAVTKSDIVFFVDSSGSMGPYIESVRENIHEFANSLIQQGIDARFAVVEYQYSIESGRVIHDMDGSGGAWTSDPSRVASVLEAISANDGDGVALEALDDAAGWSTYRSDASIYGFLLTNDNTQFSWWDSDTYIIHYDEDGNYTGYDLSENAIASRNAVVQRLKNAGIIVSVISESEYREDFYDIYNGTGGVFADIGRENFYESMLDIARWIGEESSISSADRLPYAVIEYVPYDVLTSVDENGETVLERIARQSNITSAEINVMTFDNIRNYELSLPHEPTEEMRQEARQQANGEFVAKLDTITLYSDFLSYGEPGWYLFQINVPDEIMTLPISEWKLWYVTPDEFTDAHASTTVRAAATGILDFVIFNQLGAKINTPVKKVLALIFGNTGNSLVLFVLKGIMALLTGGACNAGALTGSTMAGLLLAGIVIKLRKHKK